MCSIGEEDFGDQGGAHSMIKDEKDNGIVEDVMCKCNQDKCIIKCELKDSMCKNCFLLFVRHKFRASLGATKIVPTDARVLVNFSGSANDVCLLSMTKLGVDDIAFKKLRVDLEVIYMDDSCIRNNEDIDKRVKRIEKLKELIGNYKDINCHYASIADPLKIAPLTSVTREDLIEISKEENLFLKRFNSLQSLSSKQDFIETTKAQNLRKIAANLSCGFIFISDISIDIAKRLLQNISLGRGSSVAHDVSFCDDRVENFKILRPLKDVTSFEVENYNKFMNLDYIPHQQLYGTDAGQFASIQNLTSSFIDNLQENFSGTISTVFRSSGKIASKKSENQCRLCHSALDYKNSNTLFAIEFSRVVSEMADKELESIEKCEEKAMKAVEGRETMRNVCHGCRNIFIGLNDDEVNEMFS